MYTVDSFKDGRFSSLGWLNNADNSIVLILIRKSDSGVFFVDVDRDTYKILKSDNTKLKKLAVSMINRGLYKTSR